MGTFPGNSVWCLESGALAYCWAAIQTPRLVATVSSLYITRMAIISVLVYIFKEQMSNFRHRKTPLISTYVFSGLATVQVLIFRGPYLLSGGMIRRSEISSKEEVCSILCFLWKTSCCACFSDYVHTSRIQQYLYLGVCTFGALQPTANFRKKMKGYLFSEGYLFTGFYGQDDSLVVVLSFQSDLVTDSTLYCSILFSVLWLAPQFRF